MPKYNFNPGPAVLPAEVVERAQASLKDFRGSGLGILEISHRATNFLDLLSETKTLLRTLLAIPATHEILFCTGGATQQFSMVPMNLSAEAEAPAYLVSGIWGEKALEEAKKFTQAFALSSSKEEGFRRLPPTPEVSPSAPYLHFTSNNTIIGTQYHQDPDSGSVPLVCDASSDILSRPINFDRYSLLYAGAQKNLGPSGVTIVIVRKDALEAKRRSTLPLMLNYRTFLESDSLYNTPPTFAIYVVNEVLHWVERLGGLAAIERMNRDKADLLYKVLDNSSVYQPYVVPNDRSLMNITFRVKDAALEKRFLTEAEQAGFIGLPGHRLVGGVRASLYNACPRAAVEALTEFMVEFERRG